jgi:membrane protein DedA with SNARE-associated domain
MVSSTEKRRIVLAATVVLASVGLCGVAFAPALLTYSPLLLIAMSAIPRHLVLAAPVTDPVPFVIVATLRRVVGCTLLYFLGETFGATGLEWLERRYPKARGVVRWLERVFRKTGVLILVVAPNQAMSVLAGNVRIPLWQFVPAVTCGQVIWTALTYWLGDFLSEWTTPFLAWLRDNVVGTTLACIAVVIAYQLVRKLRQRKPSELG